MERGARAHGRKVAQAVRREAHRGPFGRVQVRTSSHLDGRQGGRGGGADTDHDAEGRDLLVGRSMAERTGVSHTTVQRIWSAFSLKPHRSETFKLSTDPLFVDKVQDIVGLYVTRTTMDNFLHRRELQSAACYTYSLHEPGSPTFSIGAERRRSKILT